MEPLTRRCFLTTAVAAASAAVTPAAPPHPHLYYRAEDLPRLRRLRDSGVHARIWENMRHSAEEYLSLKPPAAIPHGRADILYHDLYVMFYHALETMAMLEHFTFCYVLSEDERYFQKAKSWMNAILGWERAWGTPYLFSRYLHAISVFYDCCHSRLDNAERGDIRALLIDQMKVYEKDVFQAHLGDPRFSAHHATIYFGCGGVAALALLGETPDAARWLGMVKQQFAGAILPYGYGIDGGQTEGKTFWASQNLYRFFFLDALRNTTGEDWYQKYREYVERPTRYGVLSFLGGTIPRKEYYDACENVAFSADYGQLNYYAPPLLRLASLYRDRQAQWTALRDPNLGLIQKSHSGVPGIGQKVLFNQGPYAYLWCDESLPPEPPGSLPLASVFRDVEQVIMRSSWDDGALIMALEGRAAGSAAVTDFMLHYRGKTIVSYLYLEGKNLPYNQVAPNTIEFKGTDQLDARVEDFFTGPTHHYALLNAERYRRHVFFLLPETVLIFDEVSAPELPAAEIRWRLHSLGEMKAANAGRVELAVEDARLSMYTLYPENPAYRIRRDKMSKTTGGGNVKLTNEDPRDFPHLDFPLKSEAKSLQPVESIVATAFHPTDLSATIQGGLKGGAAYARISAGGDETLIVVRRDRVFQVQDIYSDARGCVVRKRGGIVNAFSIHEGSVMLDGKRPLFSSAERATLILARNDDALAGVVRVALNARAQMSFDVAPLAVHIDRKSVPFTYRNSTVELVLPAGSHTISFATRPGGPAPGKEKP